MRRIFFGGVAAGALTIAMSSAVAQTAAPQTVDTTQPAAEAADEGDVVVITGSRIRRDATNAPAPVIMIGQEELLNSGEPNLVDFLADIPALSGSTVPEDTTGANLNDGGLALLNLRDLGSVRTLVLVDGRRHVGAPQGSLSVDVDTIPSLLIEQVEIVTGGQSALYGADAVSGVVNFITKKNFSGLEVDGTIAEINQSGQLNKRISALAGGNFFDERLNVYAFGEYQEGDEVRDSDIDWRREAWTLLNNDTDPAASPVDDQIDNILIRNARDAFFVRGGLFLLSDTVQPSPTSDPDNVLQACGGNPATTSFVTNIAGNTGCFNHGIELANAFVFNGPGNARPFNYGYFQDQNGTSRRINIGGDGLNAGTEFGQGSRVPSTVNQRFQVGFNYDVLQNVNVFGEYKYVEEETYDEGQPTFFQGGIGQPIANQTASIFGSTNFNVGLDNPFIPAALRSAILSNTRPTYAAATANAPGVQTGSVADPRATFNMFGPLRDQLNNREINRAVLGVRGDIEQLAFINDINWEIGWTYGQSDNKNREHALDIIRFAYSVDAVTDTAGVLGTPGAAVCRGTLLNAMGVPVRDQWNGGFHATNDPVITECRPTNMFGVDLRDSSTEMAGRAYWDAAINVSHTNIQQDWLAFASGTLWDFWGAGPIGVAAGVESRKEKTYGVGRNSETAGRFLFLNTGPDFATAGYSVDEYFGEVQIPLLKDMFLANYAEISAAYRMSDYTTVGEQEVWNVTANYRPIEDLLLRFSYGTSIRVPNLAENFGPATQTFANGFVDPCDTTALANFTATNPVDGANRRANCITLLGAGYNPDTTQLLYPSGVPGFNSGNPFLEPEESRSYTGSIVWTPSFLPDAFNNTHLVLDYYDIKIDNVIASVTAQQAANQCVNDAGGLNSAACATITRDPATFRMISFIQGSLNYAATLAKGIDFAASTEFDLQDVVGQNWGTLGFTLRGNYLIRQQDFVNISDPSAASNFDSTVGLPRVRFLLSTTYRPIEELSIVWDMDWQAEQEILDDSVFVTNGDTRLQEYANTTDFVQHDITLNFDVAEDFRIRAGVVNLFDAEPDVWLGSTTTADNFDFFGTRFFVGFNYKY